MRNLASGNKINFSVFAIIIFVIIGILIWSVTIGIKNEKEKYQIASTCSLYDNKYNYVDLENSAEISKKWTGSYYLKENVTKKEYKLGNYAVTFDTIKKSLDLFGNFYQVLKGGEIVKYTDHNTVNKTQESQFYKIDDRKYLIVAKEITNNTGSLSTKNYLIVIMDKLGNALLLNNEINAKTINQMTISTPDFDFDVGNEVLTFGEENINLKKIIGSTNQYKPAPKVEEKEEEEAEDEEENEQEVTLAQTTVNTNDTRVVENNDTKVIVDNPIYENGGGDSGKGGSNNNAQNVGSSSQEEDTAWVDSLNDWINDVSSGFKSIYNGSSKKKDETLTKSIALNKLSSGTTFIDIDYLVVDPENKYNVVYALISNDSSSQTISLDKTSTNYRVTDLKPDTNYIVEIGYKVINSDSSVEENVEDVMSVRTGGLNEYLKFTKVTTRKVFYELKLDSNCVYDAGCALNVYLNDEEIVYTQTLSAENILTATSGVLQGSFSIPEDYKQNTEASLKIVLEGTKIDGEAANTDLISKIINY